MENSKKSKKLSNNNLNKKTDLQ